MNVVGGTGMSPKMMGQNNSGTGARPPLAHAYNPYPQYAGYGNTAMPPPTYTPAPPIPGYPVTAHTPPPGLMPAHQAPSSYTPQTGQPLQDSGEELPPGKYRGTVKAWNDMKGFGFIQ